MAKVKKNLVSALRTGQTKNKGPARNLKVGNWDKTSVHHAKRPLSSSHHDIRRWLGGDSKIKAPIQSDFDFIAVGASGLTKASVDALANHIGISRKSMAEDILDVSVKTMERKAATAKLDKKTSSHVMEIARVMQHAFEVFEDEEKVKLWMSRENRALNGKSPVQLFDTLTGLNMVNDVLGRIEEGVYS